MENDILEFTAQNEHAGKRIDAFVSEQEESLTRSSVQKLLSEGMICVNDRTISKSYKLKAGDRVTVSIPKPKELEALPENIPLNIVYEDDDLLVVDKPKGMVVHPAPGNPDGTLVNALLYHCQGSLSGINGVMRPGIVHRIDKDTSGLLIVAKNDFAHADLATQIAEHSFTREYRAVVHGNIKQDTGTVEAPIGRNPKDRKKMAVTLKNSKPATTHYEVIERYGNYTFIKCRLETGRTHQIRVHMASIGHPVAGDLVYGPKNTPKSLHGQCLHACLLGFVHPRTKQYMEFQSELPEYFQKFLRGEENNGRK